MRKGRQPRLGSPPVASAVRAGMKGGKYHPLSDHDMALMNVAVRVVVAPQAGFEAGFETGIAVTMAALAGCNNVSESAEETLSFDVINRVVHGEGHFLRSDQTVELMRSEYEYPELADRSSPGMRESMGSMDIREQAALRVQLILSTHYPQNIDPAMDKKIRDHFPILLPREHMFAGSGRW